MRIMIVDDNDLPATIARKLLKRRYPEAQIIMFNDPREALAQLRCYEADLLVSDIQMPHMEGPELARRAREMHPQIKIILMSGDIPEEQIEAPHDAFLAKPFMPAQLWEAAEKVLTG